MPLSGRCRSGKLPEKGNCIIISHGIRQSPCPPRQEDEYSENNSAYICNWKSLGVKAAITD